MLYWQIGRDILARQAEQGWGAKIIARLAHDLRTAFRFDFLGLSIDAQEREVENALLKHVTEFLLELGAGFAFVGRQVLLDVGGDEFLSGE